MSLGSRRATPGISTDAAPAAPTPKAPRLSSSTANSLTVFVDTTGESAEGSPGAKVAEIEVRERESKSGCLVIGRGRAGGGFRISLDSFLRNLILCYADRQRFRWQGHAVW